MKKTKEIKRKEEDNILLIMESSTVFFFNYFARKAQTSHLETT